MRSRRARFVLADRSWVDSFVGAPGGAPSPSTRCVAAGNRAHRRAPLRRSFPLLAIVARTMRRTRKPGDLFLAEVSLADGLVAEKGGGAVGEDDLAGLEDVATVGDAERHQGVLLDQEDGGAL